ERAIVDLENQHIGLKHLLCAARELPYAAEERAALPDEARQTLEELARRELLATVTDDGVTKLAYPKERRNIHMQVSLRSASHVTYRILDEAENEIGTIEPPNVYREAHPGAIYQHGGDDYRVTFLERENHIVRVREETAPHYTRSSSALRVRVEAASTSRVVELGGLPLRAFLGDLLVEETVHSYQELELGSDRMIRRVNLTYPLVMRLHTRGMWLEIPPEIAQGLPARADDVGAEAEAQEAGEETPVGSETLFQGLHAVQHLLTGTMPLLVMCDRRDVDGYYHVAHPDLGAPTVFVYDACQGGIGLAEVAYGHLEALLHLAHATVSDCPCASGCPSCIQSGACRLRNESLDKGVARALLDALVGTSRPPRDLLQALGRREGAAPLRDLALSRELALGELEERTRGRSLLERLPRAEARATPLASAPAERQWAEGDRVKHITYGQGVVLSSRLDGGQELVTVRFARRGMVRELDAAKARLQRLG
ncbi:MAG: DUF1998 domain-containing protein, partial [Chloroflexi bacterium]|nr:DUF1998 domain-containing protein [Chloroflexota bacterium]